LKSQQVSVLGAGSWGTALALLLCRNLDTVMIWGRSQSAALARDRSNRRYLPGFDFPDNLIVVDTLATAINRDLNFLLVPPSHGFADTVTALRTTIIGQGRDPATATLIWGTKGLDPKSGELLSQVVERLFPEAAAYGTVSGPSFARETASGLPTALTLAGNHQRTAEKLAPWFRTSSTRVYPSDDLVGVQVGGAVKNVLAIATGISDGLGYGANTRAALITRGLAEMIRFGLAVGGRMDTFNGLAGIGDLILTCTDDQSRNRRFGLGIGAGRDADEVAADIGQQIEGIQTTGEVRQRALALGVDMPITEQVYQVLFEGVSADHAVRHLLGRQPTQE